jgi:hypothetical protein
LSGTSSSIKTKLWWNSHWMVLFQNGVWQLRSPAKMAATVQLRCYWKQLWSRWAITGSWEPLVLSHQGFFSVCDGYYTRTALKLIDAKNSDCCPIHFFMTDINLISCLILLFMLLCQYMITWDQIFSCIYWKFLLVTVAPFFLSENHREVLVFIWRIKYK